MEYRLTKCALLIVSASLQELRVCEAETREAEERAAEAERIQRMPNNRERVGFRQERAQQKRVGTTGHMVWWCFPHSSRRSRQAGPQRSLFATLTKHMRHKPNNREAEFTFGTQTRAPLSLSLYYYGLPVGTLASVRRRRRSGWSEKWRHWKPSAFKFLRS